MSRWIASVSRLLYVVIVSVCLVSISEAGARYHNLRYMDDTEPTFGSADEANLTLGGQARVRWENWENFGFAEPNDDDFFLTRLRFHADAVLTPAVRVFIEGKSALSTDRDLPGGRRALDEDSADLQNAFIDLSGDLGDAAVTLRTGRQELQYGKQRLISPLDWSNTRRTFDAVRLLSSVGAWKVDGFVSELVPIDQHEFNDGDSGVDLAGVYATHVLEDQDLSYDVYWLLLDRDSATYHMVADDEERHTVGLRVWGKCPITSLDIDLEGAYQFGDFGSQDIDAYFFASEVAKPLSDLPGQPRVQLGFDYASGDDDPADSDLRTFNQLFPLGHAYLGYIDVVGRQNVMDASQGVVLWPVEKKVMFKVEHHFFWRAENDDALYNAGGGVVRTGDVSGDTDIGTELDLTLQLVINAQTKAWVGYSQFFAGDFIDASSASEDIEFLYTTLQYTF